MSAIQYGEACAPSREITMWSGGFPDSIWKTPEPIHSGCPGGSNTPGLIGGWTCPCDCHKTDGKGSRP